MTCCVELLLASVLAVPLPAPVEARVRAGLAEQWRVEASRLELDARTRLTNVRDDAEVSLEGGGREGWLAVTLRSSGAPPQVVRVRAGRRVPQAVAARALAQGVTLTAADIATGERTEWGPPRAESQLPAPEPGWVVRRPLQAGEALRWPSVAAPPIVQPGEPVTLVWEQNGVRVSRPGTAMNGAMRGGFVRVRVEGRADRVVGRATAPGEVSLPGGMR